MTTERPPRAGGPGNEMMDWLRGRLGRGQGRDRAIDRAEEFDMSDVQETASTDDGGDKNLSPAGQIRDRVIAVLKTVYDPEIPVDIYELGLVYGVDVTDGGEVHITMTLTSPMCPVAESLPPEVEEKARGVVGVKDVQLDLVWDPPWSMDMMSDSARLDLNLM